MWELVGPGSYKDSSVPSLFLRHDSARDREVMFWSLYHNRNRGPPCFSTLVIYFTLGNSYISLIYEIVYMQNNNTFCLQERLYPSKTHKNMLHSLSIKRTVVSSDRCYLTRLVAIVQHVFINI